MRTSIYTKTTNEEGHIFVYVQNKGVTIDISRFHNSNSYLVKINKCLSSNFQISLTEEESRVIIKNFIEDEFSLTDPDITLLSETEKNIYSVPLLSKEEFDTVNLDTVIKEIEYEYKVTNISFQAYYYSILLEDLKSKNSQLFQMSIDFDYSREDNILLRYKDICISFSRGDVKEDDWNHWYLNSIFLKRVENDGSELLLKLYEVYERLGLYARGMIDCQRLIFDVNGYCFFINKDDIHVPHVKRSKVIVLNEEVSKELSKLSKIISLGEGGKI